MATAIEPDPDDLKLRELGFDPSAPPERSLAALRSLIGKAGASGIAIARALGDLKIGAAADELARLEVGASGALRREIRRALFKLHQRGLDPSRQPPVVSEASRPSPEPSSLSALISPIDPSGEQIAWIIKPRARGGLTRLTGLSSDIDGLTFAAIDTQSRRELREHRGEIERRFKLKMVEADWQLADFILCDAYRRTPASLRAEVGDFLAKRAEIIAEPPPADLVHPIYAELLQEPREASADLVKEPEILNWRLPADALKPYVEEVNELQSSPLLLNPLQRRDRVDAVVDKALAGLIAGESGVRMRRRLENVAYYMARSGRTQAAQSAAAAAAAIRDGAELTRVPFFRGFIRLVLGAKLAEDEERARDEPRLVVTPAEAMHERQSRSREG